MQNSKAERRINQTDKLGFEYVIVLNRCRGRRPRLPEEKNAIQQFHNGQSRTV